MGALKWMFDREEVQVRGRLPHQENRLYRHNLIKETWSEVRTMPMTAEDIRRYGPPKTAVCDRCRRTLPLSVFRRGRTGRGYRAVCKACAEKEPV